MTARPAIHTATSRAAPTLAANAPTPGAHACIAAATAANAAAQVEDDAAASKFASAPVDHVFIANVVAAAVHANVNETIHRVAATAAPFPSARSASRHRVEALSRVNTARAPSPCATAAATAR